MQKTRSNILVSENKQFTKYTLNPSCNIHTCNQPGVTLFTKALKTQYNRCIDQHFTILMISVAVN